MPPGTAPEGRRPGDENVYTRKSNFDFFCRGPRVYNTVVELSDHVCFEEPILEASRSKAVLLGLGLDNQDGHTRITRGENFHLLGGSQETHEVMQDKCIRFNEKLQARGKRMGELVRQEFLDIAAECEMVVATPRPGQP